MASHLLYRVIYFEHCLREAGVPPLSTVSVRHPPGAERIARELRDEIQDLFPAARVHDVGPDDETPPCDLLIAVFSDQHRFPLHDVVYEQVMACDGLLAQAQRARYVMLYRASWRGAEVVPATGLRARVRRLKLERRLIGLASRSRVLRRLLQPHYGQGN